MRHDDTWAGVEVRLADNPGKRGTATGRVIGEGERLRVEVRFGPNEIVFKPAVVLERETATRSPIEHLEHGDLGMPTDLRRVLTFHKMRGHLTNVLYSMESSNTDFYPHQFRPVLKFLDSADGRLLIADEVGLGKTIEAMYIWKELEARERARRLLVVCPAMLQEKWRKDLAQRFNIQAEVLTAGALRNKLRDYATLGPRLAFTAIASLEGLRPDADWEDEGNGTIRAQIARLLDSTPVTDDGALLDLVIIDEAHYLRNPSTASNRLARLLRDAALHLVLLTATPIQLKNDNLYQLLRLVSPEVFQFSGIFEALLQANKPVTAAQRLLWAIPPDLPAAHHETTRALASPFLKGSVPLQQVHAALEGLSSLDEDTRVRLGLKLEGLSLLGRFLTRTRKRDVITPRVEREARTLLVQFTGIERDAYDRITAHIRKRATGTRGAALFVEIARQRRMASSIVPALQAWEQDSDLEEVLWDDLGRAPDLDRNAEDVESPTSSESDATISVARSADYQALEQADSKYRELVTLLGKLLARNPREKFVLFAYFRGTLAYLQRRLARDGISTALIQGGMGDEVGVVLEEFRAPGGPSVLLSSEVGSEGIDLQFCRYVINYDLPWNPMKVEQRIGRIDRLGQEAEKIFIVNFALQDTVEDRILQRLYERIGIFRESLGDLEDILGKTTEELLIDVFLRDLTDEEIERREQQIALTLAQNRQDRERLEQEAINLMAFSYYILAEVSRVRTQGRWLQPDELQRFVGDFLLQRYPGSSLRPHETRPAVSILTLSDAARHDFQGYMSRDDAARHTDLHRSGEVLCFFDPKKAGVMGRRLELLDQTHPFARWIVDCYEARPESFFPVSAVRLPSCEAGAPAGRYAYSAQLRSFAGLRRDITIGFRAMKFPGGQALGEEASERLVMAAARAGQDCPNAANRVDLAELVASVRRCDEALVESYERAMEEFRAENEYRCNVQQQSAQQFRDRRVDELRSRIDRFQREGRTIMIPATEGLVRKLDDELNLKLRQIAGRRAVDESLQFLAVGLIEVA